MSVESLVAQIDDMLQKRISYTRDGVAEELQVALSLASHLVGEKPDTLNHVLGVLKWAHEKASATPYLKGYREILARAAGALIQCLDRESVQQAFNTLLESSDSRLRGVAVRVLCSGAPSSPSIRSWLRQLMAKQDEIEHGYFWKYHSLLQVFQHLTELPEEAEMAFTVLRRASGDARRTIRAMLPEELYG